MDRRGFIKFFLLGGLLSLISTPLLFHSAPPSLTPARFWRKGPSV